MQFLSVLPRSEHSAQAEMLDMQEAAGSSPAPPTRPDWIGIALLAAPANYPLAS
jgi:hypothetical protein